MGILAIAWARNQKVGNPVGKAVLVCLANYANEYGECWPSQTTITKETELCVRTVRDWLKKLQELGFIIRSRRHRCNGARTSDNFQLPIDSIMPVSKGESAAGREEAFPAGRSKKAAARSYPKGISRTSYRHMLPDNEYIREYKKKENDTSNSQKPKRESSKLQLAIPRSKRCIAKIFVSKHEEENIIYWQDWLESNNLPPLEAYGILENRGDQKGYGLPSRWPLAENTASYENCLAYFDGKLSRRFMAENAMNSSFVSQ